MSVNYCETEREKEREREREKFKGNHNLNENKWKDVSEVERKTNITLHSKKKLQVKYESNYAKW